jgi:chromate transporter
VSSPTPADTQEYPRLGQRLWQVCLLFLKLGAIGFGGPAVTIAMMEDEVVTRCQWLSRDYFMDLIGTTNLIPGPNATEIAIHVGYLRAGWPGLVLAGACFVIPAALITGAFAWAYVRFGSLPQVAPFLQGIKPAVLAVIVTALWRLGKTAVKGWRLGVMGMAVAVASLLGVNEIVALFAGGLLGMAWLQQEKITKLFRGRDMGALGLLGPGLAPFLRQGPSAAAQITWWSLGLFFLKIGAVMYGSGYVLVAFLQGGLVDQLGWLTQQQLLDAIAAGQLTPGPLLSTATFIGYMLLGVNGAIVATVAVFLPSFVFVAILSPIVPRFRRSPWAASFLDAVNVCSLGLMAAVTVQLGTATLRDWPSVLIALAAAGAALRWKLNSAWLVLGGAVAGWVLSAVV